MPGKLLQSSHCFPSWGAGAWESSSFHHKNNPELSKQLPQLPLCISDPEPELPSPLSAEAGTAAPELSARHCEGRPPPRPPPPSARVPHQEPPTRAPWSRGRGHNPQTRCPTAVMAGQPGARALVPSSSAHPGQDSPSLEGASAPSTPRPTISGHSDTPLS